MPTYLALGDSYTIGEGVASAERWPERLAATLRARGLDLDDPKVVAKTGWTTDELSAAMEDEQVWPPAGPAYDLVTLLIGVNNQYRGRPLDEYRDEFTALLRRAIALSGDRPARVVVLAIPDWGVTPFGAGSGRDTAQIARELDAFNAAAAAICAAHGVAFVDIAPVSRARGAVLVAEDGLHPSGELHAAWAAAAELAAIRALS